MDPAPKIFLGRGESNSNQAVSANSGIAKHVEDDLSQGKPEDFPQRHKALSALIGEPGASAEPNSTIHTLSRLNQDNPANAIDNSNIAPGAAAAPALIATNANIAGNAEEATQDDLWQYSEVAKSDPTVAVILTIANAFNQVVQNFFSYVFSYVAPDAAAAPALIATNANTALDERSNNSANQAVQKNRRTCTIYSRDIASVIFSHADLPMRDALSRTGKVFNLAGKPYLNKAKLAHFVRWGRLTKKLDEKGKLPKPEEVTRDKIEEFLSKNVLAPMTCDNSSFHLFMQRRGPDKKPSMTFLLI